MKVGLYVRDVDGKVRVRRLIEDATYKPAPGYTFKGEVDETELPARDKYRDAWVCVTGKTVTKDAVKMADIDAKVPKL